MAAIPAGLFFDFDGVLVDSVPLKTEAFRTLFGWCDPKNLESILEHHRLHGGVSRVEKIRHAYREILSLPLSEQELRKLAGRYSELVLEQVIAADWVPGARKVIDYYQDRSLLFLISGTPEPELRQIVEARGVLASFVEVLGSPISKEEHLSRLLSKYELAPERCVFIGDSLTDHRAADRTRIPFIGIQGSVEFPKETKVLPDCRVLPSAICKLMSI